MTTAQAAKKVGLTPRYLRAKAKAAGVLPKRTIQTGKRGRPGYDWTDNQAQTAARA